MKVLLVCGSSRKESSNSMLLRGIGKLIPSHTCIESIALSELPLFTDQGSLGNLPKAVKLWQAQVHNADAIIISTPVYIHNIPAVLKNGLEWLTASGEFCNKRILPITYTPHPPRGEKAMQSLLWSLQALDTTVVTSLMLHKSSMQIGEGDRLVGDSDVIEMIEEAISLLGLSH